MSISRDLESTGMFKVINRSISDQHLHSCTYTMVLDLPGLIDNNLTQVTNVTYLPLRTSPSTLSGSLVRAPVLGSTLNSCVCAPHSEHRPSRSRSRFRLTKSAEFIVAMVELPSPTSGPPENPR